MKNLITINILLALFSFTAQADTISVGNIDNINVANVLLGSSSSTSCASSQTAGNCDFADANGALLTDTDLATVVTSNAANYTTSSSTGNNSSFDLGFNDFDLFNGDGDDLVIFIVGNTTSFGLDIFDTHGSLLNTGTYDVAPNDAVYDEFGNWLCVGNALNTCPNGFALSAIFIDLGDSIAGDVALGSLHFDLNDAAFSLAGGFHTEATVVPLPMPALLFSSGLFLLGWVGRKKSA